MAVRTPAKHCSTCQRPKSSRIRKDRNSLEFYCRPCNLAKHKEWYKINKFKVDAYKAKQPRSYFKNQELKTKFNLTLDQYNKMLSDQKDSCFICKTHKSMFKKALVVDHDHNTNKVRNLLCPPCNQALGMIKENFDVALNLAKYIQEHKGVI